MQFLPAYGALLQEALVTARSFDYQGVQAKVMLAEYLAAICVKTGRMKDKLRVNKFLVGEDFDVVRFKDILAKFNLNERFEQWKTEFA